MYNAVLVDASTQSIIHQRSTADMDKDTENASSRRKRRSIGGWLRHYFWQGQELRESQVEAVRLLSTQDDLPWPKRILLRYRRLIGFAIPAVFFHFFWWPAMFKFNAWHLFLEKFFMPLTMIFGSIIAGMTSEGGGAVAFPVMTLAFSISPVTARDFSILIQSVGMSAASFTILFMKVQCEWRALGLSAAGGVLGLIIGLEFIDPKLTPVQKKMGFVSIWFSFASVLLFLIIFRKGKIHNRIQRLDWMKATIVVMAGFIGGVFTALVGNGLDICTFSILTLLFRVSEKVATPTSVILMASNSIVAVIWRGIMMQGISMETWEYVATCVPVAVLGAPFGSVLGSHFHRNVLAMLVIVLDTVALITAYIVIPQTLTTGLLSGGMILGGIILFSIIAYVGHTINRSTENDDVNRGMELSNKCENTAPEEVAEPFSNGFLTKVTDNQI